MRPTFSVIIAGGRTFDDYDLLAEFCDNYLSNKINTHNIEIVSGTANGADKLGEQYADDLELVYATKTCGTFEDLNGNHADASIKRFPADWNKHGKSAGYKRNQEMGNYADALIAFWDGASRGTHHMINIMQQLNKPVTVCYYTKESI